MTVVGAGWNIARLEKRDLSNTYFAQMCEFLRQTVSFVTQNRRQQMCCLPATKSVSCSFYPNFVPVF